MASPVSRWRDCCRWRRCSRRRRRRRRRRRSRRSRRRPPCGSLCVVSMHHAHQRQDCRQPRSGGRHLLALDEGFGFLSACMSARVITISHISEFDSNMLKGACPCGHCKGWNGLRHIGASGNCTVESVTAENSPSSQHSLHAHTPSPSRGPLVVAGCHGREKPVLMIFPRALSWRVRPNPLPCWLEAPCWTRSEVSSMYIQTELWACGSSSTHSREERELPPSAPPLPRTRLGHRYSCTRSHTADN